MIVADCHALRYYATLDRCRDGDAFVLRDAVGGVEEEARPGARLEAAGRPWRLPASARTVEIREQPIGWIRGGVLATPGAVPASVRDAAARYTFFGLDDRDDAIEHARNAVAAADPLAMVATLDGSAVEPGFAIVRRGLYAASTLVLILVGASLLVGMLEQLRDRRRLLAALVAVGAQRRTLSWSVLIQTAIPVALGVGLAMVAGVGLGAILLEIVGEPVHVDIAAIGAMAGAGASVVVLVTVLALPALWRLGRPEGLRTE
jgi:predicted lysophospholipase L1 biosynthesis ABC-type transport system permease subunit